MNPYAAKNRGIPEESQKATAADDIKTMAKNLTQVATLLADRAECLLGKYSIRQLEKEAINPVPVRDFPAYWADLREYLFTIETGLGRIMSALDSAEL